MVDISENNNRIAKNTLFLYVRMLLTMIVSLYTSRVVLQTLGVEDFGIYNVVGGVVVLFTFINSAMSTGTQRHLSYELGKVDGNITKIFSACLFIHLGIAVVIFLLSETIGLWFLNTQMNFPKGRMEVVNWVYQFSIFGCLINIIRVPYQACIIAYERMSFYAYTGIVEVVLKLLIVYILLIVVSDKLFVYSILMFGVICIITFWFIIYVKRNFSQIHIIKVHDSDSYHKLISFSGWAMFGSVANVGLQQGLSIIVNIFYGVTVNAAVGIANQVNSAVMQFVSGFQQALNPQLVKSEAQQDKVRQFSLICESSKLSFLIMFFVAFPLLMNVDYVLYLWLGEYPVYTTVICQLIIIGALIECLSGPLWVTIFATGKIRTYQIVISCILLLNIPISYTAGYIGLSPKSMFIIRNIIYIIAFGIRLLFLRNYIQLPIRKIIMQVVFPICMVLFLVVIPIYCLMHFISFADNFLTLIWQTWIIILYESIIIYFVGLNSIEKKYITDIVKKRFIR